MQTVVHVPVCSQLCVVYSTSICVIASCFLTQTTFPCKLSNFFEHDQNLSLVNSSQKTSPKPQTAYFNVKKIIMIVKSKSVNRIVNLPSFFMRLTVSID